MPGREAEFLSPASAEHSDGFRAGAGVNLKSKISKRKQCAASSGIVRRLGRVCWWAQVIKAI